MASKSIFAVKPRKPHCPHITKQRRPTKEWGTMKLHMVNHVKHPYTLHRLPSRVVVMRSRCCCPRPSSCARLQINPHFKSSVHLKREGIVLLRPWRHSSNNTRRCVHWAFTVAGRRRRRRRRADMDSSSFDPNVSTSAHLTERRFNRSPSSVRSISGHGH